MLGYNPTKRKTPLSSGKKGLACEYENEDEDENYNLNDNRDN